MALGLDARATFLAIVKGDVSDAVQKFDKLGKSVDKSTGQSTSAIGKFKAFSKGAFGEVTAMLKSPAGMAAAITATGAAALAAANKFSDLAKASIDLGKATGLSTEQSSRWIAVGDDLGVSAETLATGIGRIAKTLDSAKWSNYGIATRDAAGNTRDANDVLLDALDLLGRTESATERARIGTDLFGKGFGSLAPLIGKSRDEYESMLSSVSEGQVITDGEAAAGEKWRLAMDNLSDSFGDVALSLGEVAVSLAPVVDAVADLLGYAPELLDQLGISDDSTESVQTFNNQLKRTRTSAIETAIKFGQMSTSVLENKNMFQQWGFIFKAAASDSTDQVDILKAGIEDLGKTSPKSAAQTVLALEQVLAAAEQGDAAAMAFAEGWDLSRESLDLLYESLGMTRAETALFVGQMEDFGSSPVVNTVVAGLEHLGKNADLAGRGFQFIGQNIGGVNDELDYLMGLLDDEQRVLNLQQGLLDVTEAAADYWNAVAAGTDDADQKGLAYQETAIGFKKEVLSAIGEIDNVPTAVVTRISALLDQGSFDVAASEIEGLLSGEVRFGYTGRLIDRVPGMATGGPVSGGMPYIVGEVGPELFVPSTSGTIIPNGALGGGNVTVVINNPVSSGEQIANELAAYVRRNGTRFLTGVS